MDLMILKEKRFFKKRNWDILIELNPSINTKLKIVKKSELFNELRKYTRAFYRNIS